jgi:hypothetical protein
MPKKVIDHTVTVVRDGKSQNIAPHKAFDFTAEEIKDIIRAQGEESVRDPVNEDPEQEAEVTKQAAKKGTKKAEEDGL